MSQYEATPHMHKKTATGHFWNQYKPKKNLIHTYGDKMGADGFSVTQSGGWYYTLIF